MLGRTPRRSRIDFLAPALFCLVSAVALTTSSSSDWDSIGLIVLLGFTIVTSELLSIGLPSGLWRVPSSAPYALALVLIEPVPALAITICALLLDGWLTRRPASFVVENLANYGTFVVSGSLLAHAAIERWDMAPGEPGFLLLVLVAFTYVVLLSFGFCMSLERLNNRSPSTVYRGAVLPQCAAEVPAGCTAVATAYFYGTIGLAAVGLLALAQLAFQFYFRQLILSRKRADDLQARNVELADLHTELSAHAARISALSASRGRLVGQVMEIEEVERRRLADALHDHALQNLLTALQDLRQLLPPREGHRALRALDDTVGQLRSEIFDLHPGGLEHIGLGKALTAVAHREGSRGGFRPEIVLEGETTGRHDALLLRIGRELLVNGRATPRPTRCV